MLIAYCIMCLIFGTNYLALKIGLNAGFSPFMFAGLRFSSAGTLILVYLLLRKVPLLSNRRNIGMAAVIGLCMTTVRYAALYWATQYLPIGSSALLVAVFPIMVTIVDYLLNGHRLSRMQMLGIAISFGGVGLLIAPKLSGHLSGPWLIGALAIIAGEFVAAIGQILSRRVLSRGLAPVFLNGLQMLFGSLGLLFISVLVEPNPFPAGQWTTGAAVLFYQVFLGSILGGGIYYWLVKVLNPLLPSTWSYVAPVIAMLVGFFFLRESLSPLGILASAVVLAGVFITNYEALGGALRAGKAKQAVG